MASFYPLHALRIASGDRIYALYQAADVMTDPAYQRRGIYARLKDLADGWLKEAGVPCTFNFPNANTYPAYVKFGYTTVGRLVKWVRVLKAGDGKRKWLEGPAVLWGRAAAAGAGTSRAHLLPQGEVFPLKGAVSGRYAGFRDADFMAWRYPAAMSAAAIITTGPGVCLVCEKSPRGYWVRDLSVVAGNEKEVPALLRKAVAVARADGAHHVTFEYLGGRFDGYLLRAGFLPLPGGAPFVVFPFNDEGGRMLKRRAWHITDADRDLELK